VEGDREGKEGVGKKERGGRGKGKGGDAYTVQGGLAPLYTATVHTVTPVIFVMRSH